MVASVGGRLRKLADIMLEVANDEAEFIYLGS